MGRSLRRGGRAILGSGLLCVAVAPCLAAWAAGCVASEPSPVIPGVDASFVFDAAGYDVAFPFDVNGLDVNAIDAAAFFDVAPAPEAASAQDSAPPVDSSSDDASDGAAPLEPDASDASTTPDSPSDSSAVDAAAPTDAAPPADASPDGGGAVAPSAAFLTTPREGHTATLLANGQVLFCGGYGPLASCDLYDPTTDSVSAGPSMNVPRDYSTATLLPSGQVLVAGGQAGGDAGALGDRSAEIYDPASSTFTFVAHPMAQARTSPMAVLVTGGANAGKVVVLAGVSDGTVDSGVTNDNALGSAEVFDPGANAVNGTFTLVPSAMGARRGDGFGAAPLPGGGVLVAGGFYGPGGGPYTYLASADTLDPSLTTFAPTGNVMSVPRQGAQAVAMKDGRVFVVYGQTGSGFAPSADIYDPSTGAFTKVLLPTPRHAGALALLHSGRVLLAGGAGPSGTLADLLVFDPATNTFLPVKGSLSSPRQVATATTLADGRVVIAGGLSASGFVVQTIDIFTE